MKVKVNFKSPTVLLKREKYEEMKDELAAAYFDIEQMFQENKDLRVSECHLRDEVKFLRDRCAILEAANTTWQQKHEAQRQKLVAKDIKIMNLESSCKTFNEVNKELNRKLSQAEDIAEDLSDQLESMSDTVEAQDRTIRSLENELSEATANSDSNEQLEHYKKAAVIWKEKAEAIQECREKAEDTSKDLANRFIQFYEESSARDREAQEVIADLNNELNDHSVRVDELEQRCSWLSEENAELEKELSRMAAVATEYHDKWNALIRRNGQADSFAKAIISALEKASANDTDISSAELDEV